MPIKSIILSGLCLIFVGSAIGFGLSIEQTPERIARNTFRHNDMLHNRGNVANSTFIEGFQKNNRDLIRKAIELGADINNNYDSDLTALMIATRNGSLNKVQLLLDLGANPNLGTEFTLGTVGGVLYPGSTALMIAIIGFYMQPISKRTLETAQNYKNIVRTLANFRSIDLDRQDQLGRTALMIAVLKEDEEVMQMLLEAGSFLNIENNEGQTALNIAEKINNPAIVKLIKDEYTRRKQQITKEIGEATDLLSDLTGIISEYTLC